MKSPQVKNGFLKVANELADAFARLQLSGNQWRILWVILRRTYGWEKTKDQISITQFQQQSGLNRRHTSRSLRELVERKIVTKNDTTFITTYGIQKDYSQWQLLPKKTVPQNGNETVTKNDTKTVTNFGNNKRHKNNKDTIPDFFFFLKYNSNLIDRVFDAIASTRKPMKVADSVLLN